MGYAGKLKEKKRVIELRNKGWSYRQIQSEVKVSKDTLSRWCRDVILTPEQFENLAQRKIQGSERGRLLGAKKLQNRRIEETKLLFNKGVEEVGKLSNRDRFLIGIALYAAEGTKTDRQVVFCNSNPQMIEFMSKWFREFFQIDESKIRGRLWIHKNRDVKRAKAYWSKLTNIPLSQFHKPYVAEDKTDSKKIRKNIHEYGVFSISIGNSKMHRKLMGWIGGIMSNPMI